jgi:hypothetical protein
MICISKQTAIASFSSTPLLAKSWSGLTEIGHANGQSKNFIPPVAWAETLALAIFRR